MSKRAHDVWPESLTTVGLDAVTGTIEGYELNSNLDHSIARALSHCLRGDNGANANRAMDAIIARAARRYGSTYDLAETLGTLAQRSSSVFLSRVFPDGAERPSIRFHDGLRPGPLSRLPPEAVIAWCHQGGDRWLRLAPHIPPFSCEFGDDGEAAGTSLLASEFLKAAPHPEEVVGMYLRHLAPSSWGGSKAEIMERRLASIEALCDHSAPEVVHMIARLAPGIRARIARIRHAELEEDRDRDQRFE